MGTIFNRIKADLKLLWRPILLVCGVLIVLQVMFNEVCPMKIIFGIPCPACGLTHSCIYIIMLQWKKAWLYNPTGFLWFVSIFLGLICRYILGKKSSIIMSMFVLSGLVSVIYYLYKIQMFLALHIIM